MNITKSTSSVPVDISSKIPGRTKSRRPWKTSDSSVNDEQVVARSSISQRASKRIKSKTLHQGYFKRKEKELKENLIKEKIIEMQRDREEKLEVCIFNATERNLLLIHFPIINSELFNQRAKKARKERQERAEENAKRAEKFQVITNVRKLKRLSKKKMRGIVKKNASDFLVKHARRNGDVKPKA